MERWDGTVTQSHILDPKDFSGLADLLSDTIVDIVFTKNKKPPKTPTLRPTYYNLFVHMLRAHLLVMPWKAAGQQASLYGSAYICNYSGEERCCNQYIKREEIRECVEVDNVEEEIECLEDDTADPNHMHDVWV